MNTNYIKLCLIFSTIISLPAFTQPARHLGESSTHPTARQETDIPYIGKYQNKESPSQQYTPVHSAKELTNGNQQKSPVFKQNPPQTNNLFIKGQNSGDICTEENCLIKTTSNQPLLHPSRENTHSFPITNGKSIKGRRLNSPTSHKNVWLLPDSWGKDYNQAKKDLHDATGISYSIDVSLMGQRGAPHGHITPLQTQYYGTATWDMFHSPEWGAGSLNIAYELVRYWNGNGTQLGNNIGVVSGVNDYTQKANYFYQLSYTQQFTKTLDWLSVTLGQFPMYNFDGTTYDSNQQINFINEALSQNASSTYATAGIGAYATVSPNSFWSISAGAQNATNIDGNRLSTRHLDKDKYTSFISGTINPQNKFGQATLSVLLYHQPGVPAQPEKTNGWSFNAQQNISKKTAIFGRVNGASKGVTGIRQSYVIGGVYNNPINRNALDQIGIAGAVNKLDKNVNGNGSRSLENVLEGYWAWGIGSFITVTPDIQFYINPALNTKSNTATVASLRATMMF